MKQTRRPAPNPEWVLMYRKGIPTPKIAAGAGVAATTVRYHLAIAAKQDPGLRADHHASLPSAASRVTGSGQRNMEEILAFYEAEGRLPVASRSVRETVLAGWLVRRRAEAAAGALSPAYAALDTIPNWREQPTKRDADAARWKQRLAEVAAYLAAGNEWPRVNKTDDRAERVLGVWLHTQRIEYRAGKLSAAKETRLNEVIPGWRRGGAPTAEPLYREHRQEQGESVGNFESSVFKSGLWMDSNGQTDWDLWVSVHDSDIATIEYQPSGSAAGRFYLGYQPRDYFDAPADHDPVDLAAESEGFSQWAAMVLGKDISPQEVRAIMAEEDVDEPVDTFVEDTVTRLLTRLDMPLPPWL